MIEKQEGGKEENIKEKQLNEEEDNKDKDIKSRSKAIQDVIMNSKCGSKSCRTPAQRGEKDLPQLIQCDMCNLWMHEHCMNDSSRDESLSKSSCKDCKKNFKVLNDCQIRNSEIKT